MDVTSPHDVPSDQELGLEGDGFCEQCGIQFSRENPRLEDNDLCAACVADLDGDDDDEEDEDDFYEDEDDDDDDFDDDDDEE